MKALTRLRSLTKYDGTTIEYDPSTRIHIVTLKNLSKLFVIYTKEPVKGMFQRDSGTKHHLYGYTEEGWKEVFEYYSGTDWVGQTKTRWRPGKTGNKVPTDWQGESVDEHERRDVLQWRNIDPNQEFSS